MMYGRNQTNIVKQYETLQLKMNKFFLKKHIKGKIIIKTLRGLANSGPVWARAVQGGKRMGCRAHTLEPFRPPSWSLSFRPHTNTLVLIVAADSRPAAFFLIRLIKVKK